MGTLVVGDVHGCADELDELLQRAGPDHVLLVGDLYTKGPNPEGVWRLIREHRIGAVLGNHDEHLLKTIDKGRAGASGAHRVIERLDRADPGWEAWLRARRLFAVAGPFVVVHAGLHPSGDLRLTTRDMALNMRRWPYQAPASPRGSGEMVGESPKSPPWWHVYAGDLGVCFGHDARRGHVRRDRDGEPWLVGLDTGCVYGGQLTGWWVERGEIVQIRARRAYKEIG